MVRKRVTKTSIDKARLGFAVVSEMRVYWSSVSHRARSRAFFACYLFLSILFTTVHAQICLVHFDSTSTCASAVAPVSSPDALPSAACFPEDSCTRISNTSSAVFVRDSSTASGVNVALYESDACAGEPRHVAMPSDACSSGVAINAAWSAVWGERRAFFSRFGKIYLSRPISF